MSELIQPPALMAPGVFVTEVPSASQTIAGVPTSNTAFLGRAAMGPVNAPTLVYSFGDFERLFGGLVDGFTLPLAVRDFFNNGGGTAVIVRLVHLPGGKPDEAATAATLTLRAEGADAEAAPVVTLQASNPGSWGDAVSVQVTYTEEDDIPDPVLDSINATAAPGVEISRSDLFNLQVTVQPPGSSQIAAETFLNVTLRADNRAALQSVLQQGSLYLRVQEGSIPADPGRPAVGDAPQSLSGGVDSDALVARDFIGDARDQTGLSALDKADIVNILCIPADAPEGDIDLQVWQAAIAYAADNGAFLIIDPPGSWLTAHQADSLPATAESFLTDLSAGEAGRYGMVYFPRLLQVSPLTGVEQATVGCGAIAGVFARTDASRGVWKAPAGTEATLSQIAGLQVQLSDPQTGQLNPMGVNSLRTFDPYGSVIWGARTLRGSDQLSDEYKYIPVRRLTTYIELSLRRGLQWAVFEPNDETLWAALRTTIGQFMNDLQLQGAFYSYDVRVDASTTSQADLDQGLVNVVISFAPVKPAEFVVLYLQLQAGHTA